MMPGHTLAIVSCLLAAAAVAAPSGDRPIDQTVEDLDPRAASLRRIDPGNAMYPTRSMIVERGFVADWSDVGIGPRNPHTGVPDGRRYEYRAPGVIAQMSRPDYLVLNEEGDPELNVRPAIDGAFLEQAPADTVYRLTPAAPTPFDPAYTHPDWDDTRIDGRIHMRVDTAGRRPSQTYHPGHSAVPRDASQIPQDGSMHHERVIIHRRAAGAEDEQTDAEDEQPE